MRLEKFDPAFDDLTSVLLFRSEVLAGVGGIQHVFLLLKPRLCSLHHELPDVIGQPMQPLQFLQVLPLSIGDIPRFIHRVLSLVR